MAKSGKSTGAARVKKSATPEQPPHDAKGAAPERAERNGSVDENRIARRAYEIYQARGGAPGLALDDWLQAERELRQASGRPR